MQKIWFLISLTLKAAWAMPSFAEAKGGDDDAAEMARKLQNPLANIKAIMTDDDVNFNAGVNEDEASYGFQLQPVYTISLEKQGLNLRKIALFPSEDLDCFFRFWLSVD